MAEVTLKIAGRFYPLACRDGEESHLTALGEIVDGKAQDAIRAMGNMTENRHLLVVALLLADSLKEAQHGQNGPAAPRSFEPVVAEDQVEVIERLASRMEKLATTLENGTISA